MPTLRSFSLCALGGALIACGTAATALAGESGIPRLNLRVEQVTCEEALRALERSTRVPMDLRRMLVVGSEVEQPAVDLEARVSWDWSRATLREALEALCRRYNLEVSPGFAGSFSLLPRPGSGPRQPYRPAAEVERAGVRIGVRGISWNRARNDFASAGRFYVTLAAERTNGEPLHIASLANLAAQDDLGELLKVTRTPVREVSLGDTWFGTFELTAPSPAATRLVWLEADLVTFRDGASADFTIPVPAGTGEVSPQRVNGVEISHLRRVEETSPNGESTFSAEFDGLGVARANPIQNTRLGAVSRRVTPILETVSGRLYLPTRTSFGGGYGDGKHTWQGRWTFPKTEDAAARLIFRLMREDQAELRRSFRLGNIPLPLGESAAKPPVAAVVPPPAPDANSEAQITQSAGTVETYRRVEFFTRPETTVRSNILLSLSGRVEEPLLGRIASLRNLTAQDDRGNVLRCQECGLQPAGLLWTAQPRFSAADLTAKKLRTLDGELVGWKRTEPFRAELPLPKPGQASRTQAAGVEITLTHPVKNARDSLLDRLMLRATHPGISQLSGPNGSLLRVSVVDRTGATRELQAREGTIGWGGERGSECEAAVEAPAFLRDVVSVRVEGILKAGQQRLGELHVTDIPIEQERAVLPAVKADDAIVTVARERLPFHDPNGGSMFQQVRINGEDAPTGTLSIGIARAGSSLRWVDLQLTGTGQVRLVQMQPGTYRVVRSFLPRDALALPGPGRWVNTEVRVTVSAGRETRLPPLEWRPSR